MRSCSGKQAPDRSGFIRTLIGAALLAAATLPFQVSATPATLPVAAQQHLLQQYCMSCHNYDDYAGGVEFEVFDPSKAHEDAKLTERMVKKLRAGMMPPAGKPRPDFDTEQAFATSLENEVDAHAKPNLAMPRLHRLNRSEYQNTVRDLLGLDIDVAQLLPADDVSRGFDNQAGTLTFSPALLDAYLSAAGRISRTALGTATATTQATYRVADDTSQNYHVEGLPFGTRGGLIVEHTFPADGTYTFKVFAVNLGNMGNFRPFGEIRGEQLLVYVDGRRVSQVDWDKALSVTRNIEEEATGQLKTIDVTLPHDGGPASGRRDLPGDRLRARAGYEPRVRPHHHRDGWPAGLHVLPAYRPAANRRTGARHGGHRFPEPSPHHGCATRWRVRRSVAPDRSRRSSCAAAIVATAPRRM